MNLWVDGSHVISENAANDRFELAVRAVLSTVDTSAAVNYAPNDSTPGNNGKCRHNRMFWKESVLACETLIYSIRADNASDIILQYWVLTRLVCDLKPVYLLNDTQPLEGEINFCSPFG